MDVSVLNIVLHSEWGNNSNNCSERYHLLISQHHYAVQL